MSDGIEEKFIPGALVDLSESEARFLPGQLIGGTHPEDITFISGQWGQLPNCQKKVGEQLMPWHT